MVEASVRLWFALVDRLRSAYFSLDLQRHRSPLADCMLLVFSRYCSFFHPAACAPNLPCPFVSNFRLGLHFCNPGSFRARLRRFSVKCQRAADSLRNRNGAWRVPKWRLRCILSAHIHLLWDLLQTRSTAFSALESLPRIRLVRSGGSFLSQRLSVGRKPSSRTSSWHSWQYDRNINQRVLFCRTVIRTRRHHG